MAPQYASSRRSRGILVLVSEFSAELIEKRTNRGPHGFAVNCCRPLRTVTPDHRALLHVIILPDDESCWTRRCLMLIVRLDLDDELDARNLQMAKQQLSRMPRHARIECQDMPSYPSGVIYIQHHVKSLNLESV